MKKVIFSFLVILLFSLLLLTCTEESNPIDSDTPVIDPITNQWTNEADINHTIFFITYDSTVTRGIFWGEENHPTLGTNDLCGFFDGVYVEFDVKRASSGRTKFKGKFINSNRMELDSSGAALIILTR